MKQVIKKDIKEKYNIQDDYIYTLIIDGNSLLKTSSVDKRLNDDGIEYGMVFQFLLQLKIQLQKKDYNFCYVMWDGENSGILRYHLYSDYKIDRGKNYDNSKSEYDKLINNFCKKVIQNSKYNNNKLESEEENFERQKNIIFKCLEELFIRQIMCEDVEGDDLIAYYVNHKKDNERIVIVTNDRDLTQLISDDVCVYITSLKKYVTNKNHIELFGYTHENVLLKKIFCGDNSDSIKGIKGLGEKTFFELFPEAKNEKLSVDDIINKAKQNIEERAKNKLKPLQVTKNIIDKKTLGIQKELIYEVNEKLINLKKPLLTEDAIKEIDEMSYAPLDSSGRSFKNLYDIILSNKMNDLIDSDKFSNFFSTFNNLIDKEKKYNNL